MSIESRIDRNASYTSPVSRDIFIWLSEKAMWAAVLTVSVFLAAFNLWFSRRKRP
ncbi:MAG: hypothetical protein WCC06_03185 [Candidatus Aminicenantales bacterium]